LRGGFGVNATSTEISSNGEMRQMETAQAEGGVEWRRVQVWFGPHLIVDWFGDDPQFAARLEAAQKRRFAELRVTNEPFSPSEQ
jgi:hypothetical protein